MIDKKTLSFISDLRDNNHKIWFEQNKDRYLMAKENMSLFQHHIEAMLNEHDRIESSKLYRIYRDVRFSKDKTPYKDFMDLAFTRLKPWLRGGYYIRISPGNCMLACGFWNPESADLELIRRNIEMDGRRFVGLVSSPEIVKHYGVLQGEGLKTAPKGYEKDHPQIAYIRKKQFVFFRNFKDKEVTQADFVASCNESFRALRPWLDYMSDILSHNLNGEPLYSTQ